MTIRPALLVVCALSLAWITVAAVYLYPGVKEEVDEKRYLHRVEKLHTPVLPLECGRARGVENRDFIREDRHSDRCWVTIATFNSPRDVAATIAKLPSKSPTSCGDLPSAWQSGGARADDLEPPMPPQEDLRQLMRHLTNVSD
jgi:hypothetical protein